jgi:hypothetical protein
MLFLESVLPTLFAFSGLAWWAVGIGAVFTALSAILGILLQIKNVTGYDLKTVLEARRRKHQSAAVEPVIPKPDPEPKSTITVFTREYRELDWLIEVRSEKRLGAPRAICPLCGTAFAGREIPSKRDDTSATYWMTFACDRPGCGFQLKAQGHWRFFLDGVIREIDADIRHGLFR